MRVSHLKQKSNELIFLFFYKKFHLHEINCFLILKIVFILKVLEVKRNQEKYTKHTFSKFQTLMAKNKKKLKPNKKIFLFLIFLKKRIKQLRKLLNTVYL
jgi:hypothetical protein